MRKQKKNAPNLGTYSRKPPSFWQKALRILTAVRYSMPIRLLVLQLRQNPVLVGVWVFVCLALTGAIGGGLGVHYVFLEPEYLGEVNFLSFSVVGAALGGFTFAYMVSSYLNMSYRFHFLTIQKHPFIVFCLNNFLLPGIFLTLYIVLFLKMRISEEGTLQYEVWKSLFALLLGALALFSSLTLIFFASTRNIFAKYADDLQSWINQSRSVKRTFFAHSILRQKHHSPYRTDSFLSVTPFAFLPVDARNRFPLEKIHQIMRDYHGRVLLLEALMVLSVTMFSYFDSIPLFQLPAGATGFMAMTFIIVISGALTFWIRRLGITAIILFILAIQIYPHLHFLREEHHAFGLNYDTTPTPYNEKDIVSNAQDSALDYQQTLPIFEKWKENWQAKYGKDKKPNAIFVCSSGGGLRASLLALQSLQRLDSMTNGKSTDEIKLMTGASGGMIGLAYFREAMLHRKEKPITDKHYVIQLGKDLLNPPFFKSFVDPLLPNLNVNIAGHKYDKESGYAFDKQAVINMPEFLNKNLASYVSFESSALIPQMIITPCIINQAKYLYISSLGVSYLLPPLSLGKDYKGVVQGIEFRRFFARHQPDSLQFITALRMNATFPYFFPIVSLPSEPKMEVMDAGILENFGITHSVKYARVFKNWLKQNTNKVIFISIRDTQKEVPIQKDIPENNLLRDWLNPIGGSFGTLMRRDEYLCDEMLYGLKQELGSQFEVVSIEYPTLGNTHHASLSIHLTENEKAKVKAALNLPHNRAGFAWLQQLITLK